MPDTEGGAAELLQQLAYTYVGPGVKFPPYDNPPPGYIVQITVDRIGGLGPGTHRRVSRASTSFVRSLPNGRLTKRILAAGDLEGFLTEMAAYCGRRDR